MAKGSFKMQIKSPVLRSLIDDYRIIDVCIDFIYILSLNSLTSPVSMGTGYDNVKCGLCGFRKKSLCEINLASPMHNHFGFKVICLFEILLT